jgi:hypothetical protein
MKDKIIQIISCANEGECELYGLSESGKLYVRLNRCLQGDKDCPRWELLLDSPKKVKLSKKKENYKLNQKYEKIKESLSSQER